MAVVGIGIDLVEVARVRELLNQHGDRFKARTFTEAECAYCEACADPAMHFAARFAAKEAASKALGTGFAEGVSWRDIEVVRATSGRPVLRLHGGAARRAEQLGARSWHLSLSHTKELAQAQVVADSEAPGGGA